MLEKFDLAFMYEGEGEGDGDRDGEGDATDAAKGEQGQGQVGSEREDNADNASASGAEDNAPNPGSGADDATQEAAKPIKKKKVLKGLPSGSRRAGGLEDSMAMQQSMQQSQRGNGGHGHNHSHGNPEKDGDSSDEELTQANHVIGPARWITFEFRLCNEEEDHPSNFKHTIQVVSATTRVMDLQEVVAERFWQLRSHVRLYKTTKDIAKNRPMQLLYVMADYAIEGSDNKSTPVAHVIYISNDTPRFGYSRFANSSLDLDPM